MCKLSYILPFQSISSILPVNKVSCHLEMKILQEKINFNDHKYIFV